VAINVGRQVIEASNAVVIAESVAEGIRDGIRNRKRFFTGRDGGTVAYFVLQHDGVTDPVPSHPSKERPSHDYFILFPRFGSGQSFAGGTEGERRMAALRAAEAKTFIYPETDLPPNGNGDPTLAVNDAFTGDRNDFWSVRVKKVYRLGQELVPDGVPASEILKDMDGDVLKQYGYAFTISPSFFGADLSEVRDYEPANQLYHVRVMVFRGFPDELSEYTEPPAPAYELHFEVAL